MAAYLTLQTHSFSLTAFQFENKNITLPVYRGFRKSLLVNFMLHSVLRFERNTLKNVKISLAKLTSISKF